MRIGLLAALCMSLAAPADAQESGSIKRKPPTPEVAARAAAEMAMNDSLLRKGDIVVTDRGACFVGWPLTDLPTNLSRYEIRARSENSNLKFVAPKAPISFASLKSLGGPI